jgi:DNA-binding PadR family transcriptional regulator
MVNQDAPVEKEIPFEFIPLREPTLFILLALSKERKHGYAILKEVEALSQGRVILSTGTLYGGLARLLQQGVVRISPGQGEMGSTGEKKMDSGAETRKRKYYELTQFGHRVLALEIDRMRSILAAASRELAQERV